MRDSSFAIALALTAIAAGCVETTNEDPFAYTRQALFTSGWDLSGGVNDTRQFHVNDGSIVRLRIEVSGDPEGPFSVTFINPSGREVGTMQDTGVRYVRFAPGTWDVHVEAPPEASGTLDVRIVRG